MADAIIKIMVLQHKKEHAVRCFKNHLETARKSGALQLLRVVFQWRLEAAKAHDSAALTNVALERAARAEKGHEAH